jgi:mono/diheme cytochrome c family protein
MSATTQTNDHPKFVRRLVHWWRDWIRRRAAAAEVERCGPAGVERLTQDLAVGQAELRLLAGKWPVRVNPIYRGTCSGLWAESNHPSVSRLWLEAGQVEDVGSDLRTLQSPYPAADNTKANRMVPENPVQAEWPPFALGAIVSPLIVLCAIVWCANNPAHAQQSPAAQRGLTFVRVHCAQCHAIDRSSESPLVIAPPFRTLHLKYPIESLSWRLTEGIVAGHPTMPQFRLEADQIGDVIAYLKTLAH